MISHRYKCIFIHLQRVGGSAVERLIDGEDWWSKEEKRPEKHLIASQARELYHENWDEYFKFAFVRNPWARFVSMLRWGEFLGVLQKENGSIDLTRYMNYNRFPATVEHDRRFHNLKNLPCGEPGRGFTNVLNEELDFVGRYENLEADMDHVFRTIGLEKKLEFNRSRQRYDSKNYRAYFDRTGFQAVTEMYEYDLDLYNYSF